MSINKIFRKIRNCILPYSALKGEITISGTVVDIDNCDNVIHHGLKMGRIWLDIKHKILYLDDVYFEDYSAKYNTFIKIRSNDNLKIVARGTCNITSHIFLDTDSNVLMTSEGPTHIFLNSAFMLNKRVNFDDKIITFENLKVTMLKHDYLVSSIDAQVNIIGCVFDNLRKGGISVHTLHNIKTDNTVFNYMD